MARSENQKQKLLRILELLYERTDDEHGLTVLEIISALEEYGISAERKSIYDDLLSLSSMGYEVEKLQRRPPEYYLAERVFELAELKLLVDAVQSAKFITEKKSRELIAKLETFAGRYGAGELSRQVYVEGRAKTMNKTTLYTLDSIHNAINSGRGLSFKYFDYNSRKERVLRHNGERYEVCPLALVRSEENYYLIAYEIKSGERRHYRMDKMLEVRDLELSDAAKYKSSFNSADYTQKVFGMYGGEETLVTMECDESLAGVIVDRFGIDVGMIPCEGGFKFSKKLMVSPNFYAWVAGFGSRMRITSPEWVRTEFKNMLENTLKQYCD